ncbi:hypothetical protein AB0C29_00160 [Actinoplanes sp. NPDC048791]|uniref:hypothetical protein n=1 Tax=Actinoplanes sp. NPDC048791 TaxID=3154623 RepID=UPI0033CE0DED
MTNPVRRESPDQQQSGSHGVARATLVAGGGFATAIGTILGVAGAWGYGDRVVLYALVAVCVVAALTMFTAARVARPD